ncbi:putative Beta-lactamase/transpeptidase-like protein [Seiridium unicorne]|uniref:Beta-lactamase/transpeptidase-like protein n=1 Tax=Seiridium unicorne TaxID=138068 RepID=A0ABR2UI39_9PEZI
MEAFETNLAKATDPNVRDLLGAIGLVINSKGETIYHRAFGYQSLAADASPLDPDSTIFMASAGKFLTHMAALQLVERGILSLDESVYKFLPELEELEIISASSDPDMKFTLSPQARPITLRHMLTHSSGIGSGDDVLTEAWRTATPPQEWPEGTPCIVKMFSTPLLCQPGEGWEYGHSVHWLQPLIQRAAGAKTFVEYMKEHVFDKLGLQHSSYLPLTHEHIRSKLLQCVKREEDGSISACEEGELQGLACSISDVKTILSDLLAPESRLLKKENVDLLFAPGFAVDSLAAKKIRNDEDTFAKTIGLKPDREEAAVNFTCAGALVTQGIVTESHLPAGTLTWNGWPNLIWTINREHGIATLFATQLIPVDDEKTLVHMVEFSKSAWTTFA